MSLTPETEQQLNSINKEINAIPYESAVGSQEPPDWWTDTPVAGESWVCRDYVLMKAKRLQDLGWAQASLTVVLCWTEHNEYHAVLAVRDGDGEDWIMDSRYDDIYPMSQPQPGYRWDKRQVAGTLDFQPIA